ncbi:hypothetical protein BZG02_15650 [Labilibaculum filiforme]|uniref:Uncharacterized protein n=1 Tax=Labilibaculum filiforme TaxID=1940526 RepID=A0A2N3HTM1_9BACT|nr:hypothetical protein [Labilibaculum filiforme]PKQ61393.1 hypothetical protein BZG02_15650 [Labilibaculum filiforme]
MKNYILLMGFFALLFIVGCDDDDYEAPNEVTDVSWVTGVYPGQPTVVNAGEHLSFMDLSQNVISHKWTIEDGNYFLNSKFTRADTILDAFIIPDAGVETEEELINVLFKNAGLNKVRLYNTFPDSVSYNSKNELHAVKQGDVWVIDTTFVVDVYSEIKPAFKVFHNNVEILSVTADEITSLADTATWKSYEIEAGDALKFVDLTTVGRPATRTWWLAGGRTADNAASECLVSYMKMGEFKDNLINASRVIPLGSAKKYIPLKVNVIASTQPFVFDGNLMEAESEVISFNVSGEVASTLGTENDFTAHVSNTNGFDEDIAVKSVRVNGSDATKIELVLAAPIYNTDVVTVAYAGGTIQSLDERELEAFTVQTVKMHFGASILDKSGYGFEGAANGWWIQHTAYWSASEARAASGSYSMKFSNDDVATAPGRIITYGPAPGAINAGDYLVKAKIFKEPGCTVKSFNLAFAKKWVRKELSFEALPEGEWGEVSLVFTQPEDQPEESIFMDVNGPAEYGGGTGVFYVDDIEAIPLETRP